jgi:hypothetical protein
MHERNRISKHPVHTHCVVPPRFELWVRLKLPLLLVDRLVLVLLLLLLIIILLLALGPLECFGDSWCGRELGDMGRLTAVST